MNRRVESAICIKCGAVLPVADYFCGCPHCLEKGENASVTLRYRGTPALGSGRGMLRYGDYLPYQTFPTLGEGDTPTIPIPKLAQALGLDGVYSKNEFQNPTGSHKDRMNPLIVARALDLGCHTVAAASSGNEGVSLAAYAAAAGLECCIVSTSRINPVWKTAILAAGAKLVITDTAEERWVFLKEKVEKEGWYPATNFISPPVGSNYFGLQGYKTIAYELFETFGPQKMPDYILVTVSRGDLLYGIYEGFEDLKAAGQIAALPKLVAVEPLPRIERVLAGEDYRSNFPGEYHLTESIGGGTVTYQSVLAVKNSGGFAVSLPQQEVLDNLLELSRCGLYLESSSALALGGLKKAVAAGQIPQGATALIVSTSGGTKNDPEICQEIIWQSKIAR